MFQGDEVFFAPALPLEEVFDPTGAGDVFAGGFMGYLSSSNNRSFTNMKRAVVYGSAMASFCVEKFGPQRLTEIRKDHIQNGLVSLLIWQNSGSKQACPLLEIFAVLL